MKKYLPIIIIATIVLLGGIYMLPNSVHNGHTGDQSLQSHRSYEIDVTSKQNADEITINQPTTIKYKIKNDKGEIVKNFTVAHEKIMHFILVRKDLTQFQHLHPDFNEVTGEFSVDVIFTVDGPYRFFADFTPGDENFQNLPVTVHNDINVGDISNFQPHPLTIDTKSKKTVPPDYRVAYSFDELKSKSPVTYSLSITQNNQLVSLEKYLGALGHSVVLKEGSLDYLHTHAGEQAMSGHEGHDMTTMQQDPNKIDFTTTFPDAGRYKVFTQFQHEGKVFTTDYTVEFK